MCKIEIWQRRSLVETYIADDLYDILAWFKWYWYDESQNGECAVYVYKNGTELSFEEMWDWGFYR